MTPQAIQSARLKAGPYRAPITIERSEIDACIADGLTSWAAAERLGCRRQGLLRQCYRLGIRWPYDPAQRAKKVVFARGRWWSFAEIAREIGTTRERIRRRWLLGDRGERLFRPVRQYGAEIETGLSERDWQQIADYARAHGVNYAATKFDVPRRGVQAAVQGEWWKLG